jgi:hypothetical protein
VLSLVMVFINTHCTEIKKITVVVDIGKDSLFHGTTALGKAGPRRAAQGPVTVEASRSHSDTPHSLWTGDQPNKSPQPDS